MNEEKENGGLKQRRVFNTAIFNCFTSEALYFLHRLENWCEGLAAHLTSQRKERERETTKMCDKQPMMEKRIANGVYKEIIDLGSRFPEGS